METVSRPTAPMTTPRTALLAGASGLIGNYLIFKLLKSDEYDRVISLSRRPLHLKHPKLEERVVDFDHLRPEDVAGADVVFCCLGTTIRQAGSQEAFRKVDFTYPIEIARLALAAGARHYLLISSVGADASSRIFYSRVKGEVEQAIARIGFPSYTVLRPSILLGKRKQFRPGEIFGKVADWLLTPVSLLIPPLRRYRGIQAGKVADAMIALSREPVAGMQVLESEQLQRF